MNSITSDRSGAPCGPEWDAAELFRDLIPDLTERATAFRVSGEFVDDAVLAAFERQMASAREALRTALKAADEAGIRRQAHSLQGMGGAAGAPEISVVGEELSRSARAGDFARCAVLTARLTEWSVSRVTPTDDRFRTS